MARPGYGTGSVYQRASDGRWIAAIQHDRPDGTRGPKVFSARDRASAEAQLRAWLVEHPPRPTAPASRRQEALRQAQALGRHAPSPKQIDTFDSGRKHLG